MERTTNEGASRGPSAADEHTCTLGPADAPVSGSAGAPVAADRVNAVVLARVQPFHALVHIYTEHAACQLNPPLMHKVAKMVT